MMRSSPTTERHVIHLVCSDAFAGVERYVSLLAPRQAELGWTVTVLGGDPDLMRRALEGSDVRFIPAPSLREGRRALRAAPAAAIVNTHMSDADLVGMLAAHPRRSRLVSTRHFAAPRGRSPIIRTAFSAGQSRFAAQIAISQFVAQHIGEPSSVIHTGVTDAAAGSCDERIVLMVQRLEPEKATHVALDAWAKSRARERGWQLQIAGDGSERARLERQARALGIDDSTRFLGHRSDVRALMATAGLFLAPTAREGLGLSVLEAMACGLPVIASASGGHLETIGSVEGALLFHPADVSDAAHQLDLAVTDAAARRRYGQRGRRVQRERFTIDAQTEATLDVYERCLS